MITHPEPLRVLFMATTTGEGGIERYLVSLAEALQARGIWLRLACRPGSFQERLARDHGLSTFPLRVRNSGDITAAATLAKTLRTEKIDILHVHSRRDYTVALAAVALLGRRGTRNKTKLVLHVHLIRALGEPHRLSGALLRHRSDAILGVSQAVCNHLNEVHGFPPGFVTLLHNGIPTEAYAEPYSDHWTRRRDAFRTEWEIPDTALVIGMVGRLRAKGQSDLLAVAPDLITQHPSLHIVLIGPDGEPGDRTFLEYEAKRLGVSHRVTITGVCSDIPSVLPALDILAHLPTDEALGLAIIEGGAAGLPAVVTEIPGCLEVVQNGINGITVPQGDLDRLLSALNRLLDRETGLAERKRMGEAGRKLAKARFSLAAQTDRLLEIYATLCPPKAP